MSFNYTFSLGLKTPAEQITRTIVQTFSGSLSHDVTVNTGVSNQLLSLTLTTAHMKGLYIVSSADVTFKTNSSGAPDQTIVLKAGIPLLWFADLSYFANPFTADLTALYFTNASGAQAAITIRFLTEP